MASISRRRFLSDSGKVALAAPVMALSPKPESKELEHAFVHQVYIWLKDPSSEKDKQTLIEGMRKLTAAKSIRQFHIGLPVPSERSVVDSSYSVSWLIVFDDKEGQDAYQVDPLHLEFVKNCSPLWTKVVVFDSIRV